MSTIAAIPSLGFGGYILPEGQTFEEMQLCTKVQKVFFACLFSALAGLFSPSSLAISLAFSVLAIKSILETVGTFYRARPTQSLIPQEAQALLPPLATISNKLCSGFATRDGIESHEWKLKLIRAAKQNLFLSGCYCGGRAFDEALDLIRERMHLFPNLKSSILCSDIFPTEENRRRLKEMKEEFGHRFNCLITPEIHPFLSPTTDSLTLSTHHTKALVIDYGTSFVVGGSGMVSTWTEQKGDKPAAQMESHGFVYDHLLTMKAFRDMDFVFQSPEPNGIGTRLYAEMAKLFERFRYQEPRPIQEWQAAPMEPIEMPRQIHNLNLACYTSGPEQTSPEFLEEIIHQISEAKESIFIGHMYFHPPQKMLKALIDASNRGVKISLITNQQGDQSPGTHFGYAELSRYYAQSLFEGKEKPNVDVYEYNVPYTTYHKKVIVIDRKTTLLGSSNIGSKSLGGSDYEINFKVESAEFGESVVQNLEQDKPFCTKGLSPHISLKTRILSTAQSLITPFL